MKHLLLLAVLLLSGCAVRQDADVVRVWKNCSYEFDRNGHFISDIKFGFVKPMFPEKLE